MQIVVKFNFILACILACAGCSSLQFPWVYQVRIQQGNWIEQKMLDQLEVGMTKNQVLFIMGSPMIQDTFSPDRWDYYFTVKRGEQQMKERKLALFFQDEKLSRWETNLDSAENRNDPTGRTEDELREREYLEKREQELNE